MQRNEDYMENNFDYLYNELLKQKYIKEILDEFEKTDRDKMEESQLNVDLFSEKDDKLINTSVENEKKIGNNSNLRISKEKRTIKNISKMLLLTCAKKVISLTGSKGVMKYEMRCY